MGERGEMRATCAGYLPLPVKATARRQAPTNGAVTCLGTPAINPTPTIPEISQIVAPMQATTRVDTCTEGSVRRSGAEDSTEGSVRRSGAEDSTEGSVRRSGAVDSTEGSVRWSGAVDSTEGSVSRSGAPRAA